MWGGRIAAGSLRGRLFPLLAALALPACTPALDWRTVALPDSDLVAQLPCRPGRFQRDLLVAGRPLELFMLSCEAGGATYGVATADVRDVTHVDAVLGALAEAASSAIHARGGDVRPFEPSGATPFRNSVSTHFQGNRPDGTAVEESFLVFARGARVYEATVIGSRLPDSATRPFEDGLRFDLENHQPDPR